MIVIHIAQKLAERLRDLVAKSTPGYTCERCQRWYPKDYQHVCILRPFPWETDTEVNEV